MSVAPGLGKASLLDRIGTARSLNAYVVGLAFLTDGTLAAALGNGEIVFLRGERRGIASRLAAHRGACLSMVLDARADGVLTGGDDGRLVRSDATGQSAELIAVDGRWIDRIAVCRTSGHCAVAAGKQVHLVAAGGTPTATFDHPNSVGGLAFDPKGRQLAAAHYGGVSLWWARPGKQQPRRLEWTGSHLDLSWSPDGKYIVTAMQENALHGWRLADGADMRMSGYPAKVKSVSWLARGRYLATGGAESVVCWPFDGKNGPMERAPLDLGWGFEGVVTMVAAHPRHEVVAAGYEDGTAILVQLGQLAPVLVKHPGGGAVTALAWSADGRDLAVGTEDGLVGVLQLSNWPAALE